ncbi:MAG: hypothetical protein ACOC2W_00460 [bacterium]
MTLQDIINLSTKYRDREDSIKKINISNIKYNLDSEQKIIISCTTNHKYNTIVKFINDYTITLKSNVYVHCDCKSFQYEFAYANKDDLLYPEKFVDRFPRKKNIYLIKGVCKHLYAVGRHIFYNKNKILNKIK